MHVLTCAFTIIVMRLLTLILLVLPASLCGQTTFKCGWNTYKTDYIVRQYTYGCSTQDSIRLYLQDSTVVFVAPDSQVVYSINYPSGKKYLFKNAQYYNPKKQLVKEEEFRDQDLQVVTEYTYDDKKRKKSVVEDNKLTGVVYKKTFEHSIDKQTKDSVVLEMAHSNGRVEFYTKSYYNKKGQCYKEVRLNDNNKDIVHVENFIYFPSGRLKERTVFFPEFKVTKTFPESSYDDPPKCVRNYPINIPDKFTVSSKVSYTKKLLRKNTNVFTDPDCHDFKFRFVSKDCEVSIANTKVNNMKLVLVSYREKQ
jgi:hypothetical protein